LSGLHFGLRHAADEVGLHVFRFRFGRVVHIAADVEVEIVDIDDLGLVDQAAIFGDLPFVPLVRRSLIIDMSRPGIEWPV